jgi:hypothetical protein
VGGRVGEAEAACSAAIPTLPIMLPKSLLNVS